MSVLAGKSVLIVEDDITLARNIAKLFRDSTGTEPVVAHCIENAREKTAAADKRFDLAVVDAMLPQTKKDFKLVQEFEKILARARATIEKIGETPSASQRTQLKEARFEREEALRRIFELIDREAGIKLVEEWRSSDSKNARDLPVLYLTAVGNEPARQRGADAARTRSDWLVKPVSGKLIVQKSEELLSSNMPS